MERFVGIDLGTTYSAVSTIDEYGKPVILKNSDNEVLTPSVICFEEDGTPIVGKEAKEMLLSGNQNVAMFFKRNMGNEDFFLTFHNRQYSSTDLSSILLKKLKEDAESTLGYPVHKAVITVPAYFNDLQRNETIIAAEKAGLEVLRIINEPTAAAITYGSNKSNQKIIVYDLGGGTFDVTVLEITNDTIKVLSTGGNHELGGKDWDDRILEYIALQFENEFGDDPLSTVESYNDLAFTAEKVKKQLSDTLNATVNVSFNGNRGKYNLSRDKFEELTMSLLHSTTSKTMEVLEESGLKMEDTDGILLVGGSTKMPMVVNWVRELSGKEPLRGISVDEAVCLGAAIQAQQILNPTPSYRIEGKTSEPKYRIGGKEILDMIGHSLGAIGANSDKTKYVNAIIIKKNTRIPSSETRPFQFRTRANGPNKLDVYLTQGEVEDVANCIIVGKYEFAGIEHIEGKTIIDIEYQYDANGTIHVSATQRETKRRLETKKCELPEDMGWLYRKPEFAMPHLSVVLAIDISGSMGTDGVRNAMKAAQNFVNKLDLTNASVGLVAFSDDQRVLCRLTQNATEISNSIKTIERAYDDWGAATDGEPLRLCYDLLKSRETPRAIVVLTDGEWENKQSAYSTRKKCVNENIDVIAIGLGSGVNRTFLEQIATSDEQALSTTEGKLVGDFGNIAQVLTEGGSSELKLK